MKKRKLRAKIRALKREVRELRAALLARDPWLRAFTAPFKVGDTVRVRVPNRFQEPSGAGWMS